MAFRCALSLLYNAAKHAGLFYSSCATTSPPLSLANSLPSESVKAHSFTLSFSCCVMACRSLDVRPVFSHKKHSDRLGLLLLLGGGGGGGGGLQIHQVDQMQTMLSSGLFEAYCY